MSCPNCKKQNLIKINFCKNKIERCKKCEGLWFDYDELRKAKDEQDKNLSWLDIDLWKDSKNFRASALKRKCPLCKKNLYEVEYEKSDIKVDICNSCRGVWLDKGEFKKIIAYLRNKINSETLSKYFEHIFGEAKEVFTGPEGFSSEIRDFVLVMKMLHYRIYSQYPAIKDIILHLPFTR